MIQLGSILLWWRAFSLNNFFSQSSFLCENCLQSIQIRPCAVSDTTATFWQLQGTIVAQLHSLRDLQVVVAIVLPDHDSRCIKSFVTSLKSKGWRITCSGVSYPDQGETIARACQVLIGVHTSCALIVEPIFLKEPPPTSTCPIGLFIWEPLNWLEHLVFLAKYDGDFCRQDVRFATTEPLTPSGSPTGI
jgi:hypothetical protein